MPTNLLNDPLTGNVLAGLREIRGLISHEESLPEHRELNHEVFLLWKKVYQLYTERDFDNIG